MHQLRQRDSGCVLRGTTLLQVTLPRITGMQWKRFILVVLRGGTLHVLGDWG